jgi:hypothetical protein
MTRGLLLSIGLAGVLCVDVKIDQAAWISCLNEMFRAASKPVSGAAARNLDMIPSPAAGTYNQAATREMLGRSFGHSVFPERPENTGGTRYPR